MVHNVGNYSEPVTASQLRGLEADFSVIGFAFGPLIMMLM
jgi:hypothetical protein